MVKFYMYRKFFLINAHCHCYFVLTAESDQVQQTLPEMNQSLPNGAGAVSEKMAAVTTVRAA